MMMMVSFFYERLVVHCTTWSWYWESKSCNLITALICNRERERERCNKVCNASIPNIKLLFLTEHPKVSGPAPPRPPPWGRWPHPRWEQGCLPASSRRSSFPRGRGQTELEPKFVTFAKKTFLECSVLVKHVINNHWRWYINSIWFSFCPCSVWPKKLLR